MYHGYHWGSAPALGDTTAYHRTESPGPAGGKIPFGGTCHPACRENSAQQTMKPVHYHEGRFPPEELLDWKKLLPLIGPASGAVARYDGMLAALPNPGVLLAPLTTREAVLSSRIEGTQATMGEVLEFEAGKRTASQERYDDIQEILNYRAAVGKAEEMLADLPLSGRVICAAHKILLSGARGAGRAPGEYRRTPNWIGPPGSSRENARYVPIGPEHLVGALSRWERYLHEDTPDLLVQTAIIHAEFEALHPFLDGNGRLGRMLIPLFLWQRGLIQRPVFYISEYFEARRDAYYEGLLAISRDNDWTEWCRFFLESVRIQAEANLSKTQSILDLYNDMKDRIAKATRSFHAVRAQDWMFKQPIFSSAAFVRGAGIPRPSAHRILNELKQQDILQQILPRRGNQPSIFLFPTLLQIVEGTGAL